MIAGLMRLLHKITLISLTQVHLAVLQIFQWWVLMILVLVYCLLSKLYVLSIDYDITLESYRLQQLARFSMNSFAALLLLYGLSLVSVALQIVTHFALQVCRCRLLLKGSWMLSKPRDVAIAVLVLPMLYGLMSAEAVSLMWVNMTGEREAALSCGGWSFAEQQDINREIFLASFALGDMYEAWCLYCFGQMVAKSLQKDLRKDISIGFFTTFEDLLLIDVKGFVFVGLLTSCYRTALTWSKWRLGLDICGEYAWVCTFEPYLVGANWCVSSVAIYNLMMIEYKFHGLDGMKTFKGALKFFSIKLMVLVSFWVSILMSLIEDKLQLTPDQGDLLDASFRIYVMTIVAVLNIWGWWPWTGWYHFADQALEDSSLMGGDALTIGARRAPPGAISMVKDVLGVSHNEAQDLDTVRKAIDELQPADLIKVLYRGSQFGWGVAAPSAVPQNVPSAGILFRAKTVDSTRRHMIEMDFVDQRNALREHLTSFYHNLEESRADSGHGKEKSKKW